MKRILALLLCLALFLPVLSFAETEEEIDLDDLFDDEDIDLDLDDDGNIVLPDEEEAPGNGEDDFSFSEEEMQALSENVLLDENVDPSELELNNNLPDDVINILLIGLDVKGTRKDKLLKDQGKYAKRADVQMILSIDKVDGSIKLTSIARNTEVDVPDRSKNTLIANSYGHGVYKNGKYVRWEETPYMCLRTVNRNFEMNIQYYVAINFYGVVSIIEYLGGADVDLTKKEADYINYYLKKNKTAISNSYDDKKGKRDRLESRAGVQHLDGLQALMYARTRELDDDFGRTGRTRKLLSGLLTPTVAKIKSRELDVFSLLSESIQYLATNMNLQTMLDIINTVLHSDVVKNLDMAVSLVDEFRIPTDGSWYDPYKTGESSVSMNRFKKGQKQMNVEMLHDFIYGAYYPAN